MVHGKIAVQARGLRKTFGTQIVLNRLDLDVRAGETVALMGANGAGKTTLLRCLASTLRPTSGELLWFGRAAAADRTARRLVGLAGHESMLYPNLTAEENLLFAARMCDLPHPSRRVADLLRDAGLRPFSHRPTDRLSRGQRQRLSLMRAVVHDPQILLLDEPFSGLDSDGYEWLLTFLSQLRERGRAICLAVHDAEQARRLADRVVVLRGGRLQDQEMAHESVCA